MPIPASAPLRLAPAPQPPPSPDLALPAEPPAALSPWAWATAFVLGQPNAHRLVRAFFVGLIGLTTVLLGGLRGCR
jgi:hypothetical protein